MCMWVSGTCVHVSEWHMCVRFQRVSEPSGTSLWTTESQHVRKLKKCLEDIHMYPAMRHMVT